MAKQKIVYLEWLRIFASFCVILLHCIATYLVSDSIFGTKTWWGIAGLNAICRAGVPLFFMISGYLLLNPQKEESISTFLKKRLIRILIPFLVWSFLYYSNSCVMQKEAFSMLTFFTRFFQKEIGYHFWFIDTLLSLYLFVPLGRKLTKHCSDKELWYLLLLILIPTTIRPLINKTFNIWIALCNPIIEGYAGYFLLGYLLGKVDWKKSFRFILYGLGIFSMCMSVVGTYFLSSPDKIDPFFNGGYQWTSYLTGAAFFVFAKQLFSRLPQEGKGISIIEQMGKLSFGAYLIHALLIEKLQLYLPISYLPLQILVYSVVAFCLSYGIAFVCNRFRWSQRLFL